MYKIGILGSENSHATGFVQIFNTDKAFPGFRVTHIGAITRRRAKSLWRSTVLKLK